MEPRVETGELYQIGPDRRDGADRRQMKRHVQRVERRDGVEVAQQVGADRRRRTLLKSSVFDR